MRWCANYRTFVAVFLIASLTFITSGCPNGESETASKPTDGGWSKCGTPGQMEADVEFWEEGLRLPRTIRWQTSDGYRAVVRYTAMGQLSRRTVTTPWGSAFQATEWDAQGRVEYDYYDTRIHVYDASEQFVIAPNTFTDVVCAIEGVYLRGNKELRAYPKIPAHL